MGVGVLHHGQRQTLGGHVGVGMGLLVGSFHLRIEDAADDARHSQRVFKELAHAVFEEGRALAHDVLLPLFVFRRLFEL